MVGKTAEVDFITVFAADELSTDDRDKIVTALLSVKDDGQLLKQMESLDGFIKVDQKPANNDHSPSWTVFKSTSWKMENIHYRIGMRCEFNPAELHIPFRNYFIAGLSFKPGSTRGKQVEDSDRPDLPGPRSTTFQKAKRTP